MSYCIIETDRGWSIAQCQKTETAEQAADRLGGIVIDPGPYRSYEDATEALVSLQDELADDGEYDLPATQVLEPRGDDD